MAGQENASVPFSDPLWHKDKFHPYYKDSHQRLQVWMRNYIDTYIEPHAYEWETQGYVPDEAFQRHAKLGVLAASCYPLPKQHLDGVTLPAGIGLSEWDIFHYAIVIDEIARCGYLGVVWGINGGATVGNTPLSTKCTEHQKRKWLAPLLRGEQRHALAVTEPAAGSDVGGLQTTAVKSEDAKYWIVNGNKKWVTQGQFADWALVAARTGGAGNKGISTMMVDLRSEGITRRKMENSGVRSSGSAFVEFDDVKVPVENLIGQENEGFKVIMSTFNHERLWVGIIANRLGRVALCDSYNHALRRRTFGRPIMENQVIRAKFTKMAGLLEATSALTEAVIHMSEQAPLDALSTYSALVKYRAAHDLEKISREAQQVFGGLAYSRGGLGARVEQISRDVRVLVVSGGSEEILMDLVAKRSRGSSKI
ncbi:hypothetical protein PV08_04159 [Exophiala spinifera]|uniref:Acyl-CoA dehydrogenase n=1 Tax=Exophiala spinifera TaxID=91928 RepID=A0A0D2BDF6_9EURO|nr:uncharacterized protein PV08_04159 [Exophiala spinifera]KIW16968.1 hypothetical protein PV08_04159 [Exophiala spinifera]